MELKNSLLEKVQNENSTNETAIIQFNSLKPYNSLIKNVNEFSTRYNEIENLISRKEFDASKKALEIMNTPFDFNFKNFIEINNKIPLKINKIKNQILLNHLKDLKQNNNVKDIYSKYSSNLNKISKHEKAEKEAKKINILFDDGGQGTKFLGGIILIYAIRLYLGGITFFSNIFTGIVDFFVIGCILLFIWAKIVKSKEDKKINEMKVENHILLKKITEILT